MIGWVIEPMRDSDWAAVREIYREGVATGNATFETGVPEWPAWDAAHLPHSRLVARRGGGLGGWAALAPVSSRAAYAGVAEVSIYVSEADRGQGLGRRLLAALVEESEGHGIWTLQAGIFPENLASLALHERMGFRLVGRRERIGRSHLSHHGRWRDTLLLERRSQVVGL
jgi:L-amino acid N-acyltransferase YncA